MSDEVTVEQCLKELREMFPDTWLSLEVTWKPIIGHCYFIRVYGAPKQVQAKATLAEAMENIRTWKESQQQE